MKRDRGAGAGSAVPEHAVRLHDQLRALAWLLDSSIRLPGGFRIGVDAILGLVPFLGDAAGVLLSGYIVSQAARLGVPRSVLLRMVLNVAVEGLIGIVPVAGDVFDAAWKANLRNVELLGQHLANPGSTARSSRLLVGALVLLVVLFMALAGVLSALFLGWIWSAVRA